MADATDLGFTEVEMPEGTQYGDLYPGYSETVASYLLDELADPLLTRVFDLGAAMRDVQSRRPLPTRAMRDKARALHDAATAARTAHMRDWYAGELVRKGLGAFMMADL